MIKYLTKKEIFTRIYERPKALAYSPVVNKHQIRVASKVMDSYIKDMYDAVLMGYIWDIPRFGNFRLVVEDTKRRPLTKRYYRGNTFIRNTHAMNPRLISKTVSFRFIDDFLDKHKCKFRACPTMRKRLTNMLYNTDFGEKLLRCQ